MLADPRFATNPIRVQNRQLVTDTLTPVMKSKTTAEWIEAINAVGVPCGPIYTVDQTFADPQVRHIGIVAKVDHPKLGKRELVGQPIHMTRTPWKMRSATTEPGEHNRSILSELGYDETQIAALRKDKVI